MVLEGESFGKALHVGDGKPMVAQGGVPFYRDG